MAKVKRSLFRSFLNTGTDASPVWVLLGPGVSSASIAYNPKTEEVTYIHEDNASISVESYAPNFPVEATAIAGDGVFEYIDGLRKGRGVLSGAETSIVNVWLYSVDAGYTVFPAEKQYVSIMVDEFGGEGGSSAKLNYTINFIGDPIVGIFKPEATAEFIATPVDSTVALTSLTFGSGTLTPAFAAQTLFYKISVAASSVTVSSVKSGATIVQKCNGIEVAQGAAAALNLGKNIITLDVTAGTKRAIYSILATRTV